MKEVAFAAYTNMAQNEPGLEATYYYDPPNMTYPNGAYVAVVDVDRETGETKVRRFVAVDDCGIVINPMIVEGQIHGGLTEGFAMAFIQEIQYDAEGNNLNTNFTDYLVPTSLETPHWETGEHRDAEPAPSDGRERRGGEPERRQPRRVRQRRHRCAVAAGRAAHRHAGHTRQGVARDPRRGSQGRRR